MIQDDTKSLTKCLRRGQIEAKFCSVCRALEQNTSPIGLAVLAVSQGPLRLIIPNHSTTAAHVTRLRKLNRKQDACPRVGYIENCQVHKSTLADLSWINRHQQKPELELKSILPSEAADLTQIPPHLVWSCRPCGRSTDITPIHRY
jgi:hypothetical protein